MTRASPVLPDYAKVKFFEETFTVTYILNDKTRPTCTMNIY